MITNFDNEYAFLSNFYYSPFELFGLKWPTVEHCFQGMKTLDVTARTNIQAASTPGNAKRLGRMVKLRKDWEQVKNDIMYEAVSAKFKQNRTLAKELLATGDEYLIEGNTWGDVVWGAVFNVSANKFTGENRLGKILMRVREELKEGK